MPTKEKSARQPEEPQSTGRRWRATPEKPANRENPRYGFPVFPRKSSAHIVPPIRCLCLFCNRESPWPCRSFAQRRERSPRRTLAVGLVECVYRQVQESSFLHVVCLKNITQLLHCIRGSSFDSTLSLMGWRAKSCIRAFSSKHAEIFPYGYAIQRIKCDAFFTNL